jgi:hypothetical protein
VIIRRLLDSTVSDYLIQVLGMEGTDKTYENYLCFADKKAEDTYYQANNWASYDDWRRARDQWDYFYSRNR